MPRLVILILAMVYVVAPATAATVRIGQGVPTLSFLPLWAARALGSFPAQGLELKFVSLSGGDPPALAALDAGDIDFAAVGSDTALAAIGKGQPFQMIYALMSQVSLELVVSDALLKRTGVSPQSPLKSRIAALKGAIIGVSAVGGAQDRIARWLAEQGGLNAQHDIKIAMIGPPPAIHAALDNGQIDAFLLSPPEGQLSEAANTGKVLIRLGAEFPDLSTLPYLVLVAKTPLDGARRDLAVASVRALQAASAATLKDPAAVAAAIQSKFFPKLTSDAVLAAIETMKAGIAGGGSITAPGIDHALQFVSATGTTFNQKLDAAGGGFWTDAIVTAAEQGKSP